jgi:hypothetical protein
LVREHRHTAAPFEILSPGRWSGGWGFSISTELMLACWLGLTAQRDRQRESEKRGKVEMAIHILKTTNVFVGSVHVKSEPSNQHTSTPAKHNVQSPKVDLLHHPDKLDHQPNQSLNQSIDHTHQSGPQHN